jgi:predicted cupin superfamily sugar epimerase
LDRLEKNMRLTPEQIIETLVLEPLPIEGGLFRQTYNSSENIKKEHLPGRYNADKPFGTAIYYLLTSDPNSFSALHKLPTDEIWHFYLGDPVELFELHQDGSSQHLLLGQDIVNGQLVQHVVPAGIWQGSRVRRGGEFALLGTTMAPGYSPEDYVGGERNELIEKYPEEKDLIKQLTRQ